MSYPQRLRLARQRGLALTYARTLARLRTPQAIQDFLVELPQNFEPDGDTARSVQSTLAAGRAHCIEGAMVAAFALWLQGHQPLLLDFSAHQDMDHVIAPFRVDRSVRELAMSYFHEYAKGPRKTLRSYSRPFDLRTVPTARWVNLPTDCWEIADRITAARHYEIVSPAEARRLRHRDAVEVRSDRLTVFPIPAGKKRRL